MVLESVPAQEIQKLLKMGIPGIVIKAIMESNKRFPPAAGGAGQVPGRAQGTRQIPGRPGGGPGRTVPASPPPGPSKEARLLIGSWHARAVDPMLGLVDITMTFFPNGKLSIKGVMGGFKIDDLASYSVSGNNITTVIERTTNPTARGQKKTLQFQFAGPNVLKIYDPTAQRWNTLQRVGGR